MVLIVLWLTLAFIASFFLVVLLSGSVLAYVGS